MFAPGTRKGVMSTDCGVFEKVLVRRIVPLTITVASSSTELIVTATGSFVVRLTVDDFVRTCAVDDAAPAAMIAQTIAAIRAGLASHACGGADLAMSDREA